MDRLHSSNSSPRRASRSAYNLSQQAKIATGLVLVFLTVLAVFPLLNVAGGGTPILGCTNLLACPISFDQALVVNSTIEPIQVLTSAIFTVTLNETIVVAAHSSLSGANVSSVVDSQGNVYTRQVRVGTTISEGWMDVWTAHSQLGADAVTVTWTISDLNLFVIGVYRNAQFVGAVNGKSQQNPTVTSLTTSITTNGRASGSWAIGVGGTNSGNSICNQLTVLTNFTQRVYGCAATGGGPTQIFLSDNATGLPDRFVIPFTATSTGAAVPIDVAEIELIPYDAEAIQVFFTMPFATKTVGSNTLQTLTLGTLYCTGLETTQLVTTPGVSIFASGFYSGQSRNVTGAIVQVKLWFGPNIPSSSFGTGACAAGGGLMSVSKLYMVTSGSALTSFGLNEYDTTLGGSTTTIQNGYFWLEITWQGCSPACAGSTMLYAQWGASGHTGITAYETK